MCVILYTEINGKKILAKNRDGTHVPKIEIIHEIVNGIEIVYLKDKVTGWVEGFTEKGTALINSTLNENEGKQMTRLGFKKPIFIYHLLNHPQNKKHFFDYIHEHKQYLEGHTLLMLDGEIYHLEKKLKDSKKKLVIEKTKKPSVYTNHGIHIKNAGNTKCVKGMSSFLRRKMMCTELKKNNIKSVDELVNLMNVNYTNINPIFHTYRDKYLSNKLTSTSGQLVLNITDNEFIYYTDIHNSKKVTYINKLPKTYNPKIRVIIKETEKNLQNKKKIFTRKYIQSLSKKFPCSKTQKNLFKNKLTNKLTQTRKHKRL